MFVRIVDLMCQVAYVNLTHVLSIAISDDKLQAIIIMDNGTFIPVSSDEADKVLRAAEKIATPSSPNHFGRN